MSRSPLPTRCPLTAMPPAAQSADALTASCPTSRRIVGQSLYADVMSSIATLISVMGLLQVSLTSSTRHGVLRDPWPSAQAALQRDGELVERV